MATKLRRRLLTALAIIAAGILPFVLLEAGLRIFHYGYPTGFFVPVANRQAFASNDRFGCRFFPAAMARVPVVSYVPARKDPNHYRIFILGDSAAMGIPEPAFSFGRMLRVLLEARYPDTKFEVINTAMTAINSHVLPPIASDSAKLEPDLFIVLAGNNEVVGPYGPGTVLAGYSPALSLIRASVWFKSTRTAQLMERLLPGAQSDARWGGIAMFTEHQVAHDDKRLASVYRNFRANLESIAASSTPTIFSTVPVNLKDRPPFASQHKTGLSAAALAEWRHLYDAGDCPSLRRAAQLDNEYADLRYRLGHCLLDAGDTGGARAQFIAARDLDTLRFRADSEINRAIREAAANARLVDAERDLSPLPGNELFFEHVHLRFPGNYKLAQLMLPQVEATLPAATRARRRDVLLSQEDVAVALGFTEWDGDKSEMEMLTMMQQPPFTPQPAIDEKLAQLQQKWSSPDKAAGLRQHVAQYDAALQGHPDDPELREMLAELLSKSGDNAAAAQQYRKLIDLLPDIPRWHANLAHALMEQRDYDGARAEAETALRFDPQLAVAQFTLGTIAERTGNLPQALERYDDLLRTRPDYADPYAREAVIFGRQGKYREAVARYQSYLQLMPGSPQVESNVGVLLVRLGDIAAAVPHYRNALRLNPNFPEAANNLGAALERLGQKHESIDWYRAALTLRPDFPEARAHLAAALEKH